MEQRIQQFHDDTKNIPKPPTAKTAYFTVFDRSGLTGQVSSFPLIEDALKVPCFTTKQKSQLLKWYDEILAKQEGRDVPKKEDHNNNDEENYDDFDWDAFEKEGYTSD
ncbi:hypothetical protein RMCBS344292_05362 [Rhizopus microsporus]|nr:hypothetical protein RMCBS344292_05362 [Rhizopus microsporus]